MQRSYFTALEDASPEQRIPLSEVISQLAFNQQGLIPVITQDADSKTVLMQAWMNQEALQATISSGRMTYWSRSRQALWLKGETSGHFQQLVSMSFDCDGDCILCLVKQQGSACHTGRPNCFYLQVNPQQDNVQVLDTASLSN